jgi:plasmid stability protein
MEQEARDILTNAVRHESESRGGLGTEIAVLFADVGLEADIEELRGHTIAPARFRS